jgi:hypothetical protein
MNLVHPVGSIYLTTESTSLAELFGGTRLQTKDTCLAASSDNFGAADSYGANKIDKTQLPRHAHRVEYSIKGNSTYDTNWGNDTLKVDTTSSGRSTETSSGLRVGVLRSGSHTVQDGDLVYWLGWAGYLSSTATVWTSSLWASRMLNKNGELYYPYRYSVNIFKRLT